MDFMEPVKGRRVEVSIATSTDRQPGDNTVIKMTVSDAAR